MLTYSKVEHHANSHQKQIQSNDSKTSFASLKQPFFSKPDLCCTPNIRVQKKYILNFLFIPRTRPGPAAGPPQLLGEIFGFLIAYIIWVCIFNILINDQYSPGAIYMNDFEAAHR